MRDICKSKIFERAKSDLRLGLPILFDNIVQKYLVCSLELLDEEMFSLYQGIGYELIVSSVKAKTLYNITTKYGLRLKPEKFSLSINEIQNIAMNSEGLHASFSTYESEEHDELIVKLVKSAELLPCIIIARADNTKVKNWCYKNNIITIKSSEIQQEKSSITINEVCRAPLILRDARIAEIIIYRNYSKEHYAIIIGNPLTQKQPLVRIHSSCYTGDLLDSLTCDCGGQLRSTIKLMSGGDGGIILYLSQEGRGIGLINKIRAYAEQAFNNRDTVDANRSLGFEDDERDFTIAAIILKKLNVRMVRLVTNNSEKISQLENNKIEIVSYVPSKIKYNRYNMHYLHTKFNKLGHMINY